MLWSTPASAQKSNHCAGVKCPANASCHETEAGHACLCNHGYLADPLQGAVCLRDKTVPLPNAQIESAGRQAKTGVVLGFMGAGFMVASTVVFWTSAAKAIGCMLSSSEDCGPSNPLHATYGLHVTGMAFLTMGVPVTYLAQARALRIAGARATPALKGFRAAAWAAYSLSMASFALWFVSDFGYIAPIIGEVFALASTAFGIVGWSIAGNIARKAIDDPMQDAPVIAPAVAPVHGGMMFGVGGIF